MSEGNDMCLCLVRDIVQLVIPLDQVSLRKQALLSLRLGLLSLLTNYLL